MNTDIELTSDASYRRYVERTAHTAIFFLTTDGTVASWSRAAQRIKGYSREEIVGRHFSIFYSPTDIAAGIPANALATAQRTGSFSGEGWRLRRDGSRFWASVAIDAVFDEAHTLVGFAKMTRDVTGLSIIEEQRRAVVDAAPDGMLVIDTEGNVSLANAQAERIFGYRSDGLTNRPLDDLLGREGCDVHDLGRVAVAGDHAKSLLPYCGRIALIGHRSDGSVFPADVIFNIAPTARGPVIVVSVTDVTLQRAAEDERRRSELELRTANRLMTMAEELARYGHWRIDLQTRDLLWSDEVYRVCGLPLNARPKLEIGIATYDPEGVDVGEVLRRAALDGEPFSFEQRKLRPDGTFRDVRIAGRGERDASGTIVGLVGILQDITERKDAERERDKLIERVTLATQAGKVGIWEWNMAAGTMSWDTHVFALYGLEEGRIAPSHEAWRETLVIEDRERVMAALDDAFTGRKPFDTEFRVVWPNGEIHAIRAQATVLRNAADDPVRMVGINWDITEARSLADELREETERQRTAERERLYERERKWSTTFQRAVLPLALPKISGCRFDAVYEPGLGDAKVGGDWYDAVHLMDGRILISIGDVAGSGLEAAVVVGVVRQIMRGISQLHANPTLILDAADRALCLEYPGVYVSAWIGLIDLVTRTITYASAGHPPPLIVSPDGGVAELGDPTTLLIGLREGHRGESRSARIAQNDTIVLYTDGVTESTHDIIAGTRALHAAAATVAQGSSRNPADAIKRSVIPEGALDDVAILVVRIDIGEAERCIRRWRFDVLDARAASVARAEFIASLEEHAFSFDDRANAELVFGELVGNVVRHAAHGGSVEVAIDHGPVHSVLHVFDHGPGFHHISRLPPDPYAENGRGLFLIAALTVDFTVAERAEGGSHARAVLRGGSSTATRGRRQPALSHGVAAR